MCVHPRRVAMAVKVTARASMVLDWYTKHHGGVDLSTKLLNAMNLYRRDTKWTCRVWTGILGLSVVNMRRIWEAQHTDSKLTDTDIMRQLGLQLTELP